MKNFYMLVSVLFILGCGDSGSNRSSRTSEPSSGEDNSTRVSKIMPLGDSITWDWYFEDTRTDAERSGYRNYLWYKLENAEYLADFVGSQTTGGAIEPHFDGDNEGYPGRTSHQIANNVYGYLQTSLTDIVLLHIGSNDQSDSVVGVENILDEIDRFEGDSGTNIKVVLALVMSHAMNPGQVSQYNENLYAMAQSRIENGDDILIVDMEHSAGLNYNKDFVDEVHPNDCGYEKMANVWFTALTGLASPGITYADCD